MGDAASHAEQSTKVTPGTVLFTAVRNEAPFLIEWIAYHKVIGFERVIIYANASDDGTEALLEALSAAGEIEYVFHEPPERVSAQGNAARLANESGVIPDGAWVLWLDADEFLNVRVGDGRVRTLINAIRPGAVSVLLNWRVFGALDDTKYPLRFISDAGHRASRRAAKVNNVVKTLFRWGDPFCGFAQWGIHRPMIGKQHGADISIAVNGSNATLVDNEVNQTWLSGKDHWKSCQISPVEAGFRLAQINHYCVRSAANYLLKRRRGDGLAKSASNQPDPRRTSVFFAKHNLRDVEETSILRHAAATTIEMERLRALPGVAEAEAEALRLTAAMIAAIPPDEFAALSGVQQSGASPRTAT